MVHNLQFPGNKNFNRCIKKNLSGMRNKTLNRKFSNFLKIFQKLHKLLRQYRVQCRILWVTNRGPYMNKKLLQSFVLESVKNSIYDNCKNTSIFSTLCCVTTCNFGIIFKCIYALRESISRGYRFVFVRKGTNIFFYSVLFIHLSPYNQIN